MSNLAGEININPKSPVMNTNVFIPSEEKFREILSETVDSILEHRIPQIIRQANRKAYLTTAELKELTGMSFRMQKYYRDEGYLSFSQSGRKIFYQTEEVERFMNSHKIKALKEKEAKK